MLVSGPSRIESGAVSGDSTGIVNVNVVPSPSTPVLSTLMSPPCNSISFLVSCAAFFLNKIHSFTAAKNLALWVISGEIIPLDLMPEPFRTILIALPFSSGVFIPVGYLTVAAACTRLAGRRCRGGTMLLTTRLESAS